MNGEVDHSGRAIVSLSVRPSADGDASTLAACVDTAFTGELVVPGKWSENWDCGNRPQ
jgi:predicted aspartyl protease